MTVGGPVQQSQLDDAGASAIARRRRGPNAATTQRFVLLVALFLVSSFFMMSTIWAAVAQPRDMAQSCAIGAGHALQATSAQNYLVTNTPAFYACLARFDDLGRIFGFGYYLATIAPLALVLLTYLLQPWWKRTFTRALWITEAQFPKAVGSELRGLAAVSGLNPGRQVSFVVDATSASTDAVVFGRPGRYTVVLKGGMCAQLRENPGAFKATVLHELAHIRNKDVDIAYLTLAVWRVFLVAVLIPFTAVNIWWLAQGAVSGGGLASALSGTWPDLLRGLILASFMVCLMYLAMADTLRAREMCADLEAVALGADRRCWARYVPASPASMPKVTAAGRARVLVRAVRSALKTHPDWAERAKALHDRSSLFAVRALPMFLAGAAIDMLSFELSFSPASQGALLSAGNGGLERLLLFDDPGVYPATVLATAIAGVLVWREVVLRADAGLPLPSGLRAGFWFGAGHLAGELLVGQVLSRWVLASPRVLMLLLPLLVPMALLWWTAGCARLWADLPARRRRVAAVATLAVCALAFSWWYQTWQSWTVVFLTGYVIKTSTIMAAFYAGLGRSTSLKVIATLSLPVEGASGGADIWVTAGLWLIPLAGTLRRKRLAGTPLETPAAIQMARKILPRWLVHPAFIGLAGGSAAATAILFITAIVHASVWTAPMPVYEAGIFVISGWRFAVMLAGVSVSAVLAAVTGRGTAVGAAVAAYCAMTVGLLVLFALSYTDGCVHPLALVYGKCTVQASAGWALLSEFLPWLIGLAGIVSLVVAAPAAAIARLAYKAGSRIGASEAPALFSARRRAIWLSGFAATGALLLAVSAICFIQDESGRFSGPSESTSTLPQPGHASSTKLRNWFYYGGQNLMYTYEEDLATADSSISTNGAIRKACADLEIMVNQAQIYPPIPMAALQKAWAATLTTTRRSARQCVDALDRSDSKELTSALKALNPQTDPVLAIFDKIKSLAKLK